MKINENHEKNAMEINKKPAEDEWKAIPTYYHLLHKNAYRINAGTEKLTISQFFLAFFL